MVDDTVYVANLGDSRVTLFMLHRNSSSSSLCFIIVLVPLKCVCCQAVLCRMEEAEGQKRPVTLALSKEHNPTIYEERMRIQRAGGTVR